MISVLHNDWNHFKLKNISIRVQDLHDIGCKKDSMDLSLIKIWPIEQNENKVMTEGPINDKKYQVNIHLRPFIK